VIDTKDIAIACVLVGEKYSLDDVSFLKANLQGTMKTRPFYCLTEVGRNLTSFPSIIKSPLSEIASGWWNKFFLFSPNRFTERFVLYLDLDVLVLQDLLPIFCTLEKDRVYFSQDFIEGLSSSMMLIDTQSKTAKTLWRGYGLERSLSRYGSDQDLMETLLIKNEQQLNLLNCRYHYSYKYLVNWQNWRERCRNPSIGLIQFDEIFSLNFHGKPKISEILRLPERWPLGRKIFEAANQNSSNQTDTLPKCSSP